MPMRTLRLVSIIYVMTNKMTIHNILHGSGLYGKCAAYTGVSTRITWGPKIYTQNHSKLLPFFTYQNWVFRSKGKRRNIPHKRVQGGRRWDLSFYLPGECSKSDNTRERYMDVRYTIPDAAMAFIGTMEQYKREKGCMIHTCSQRAWRNSEYAIGLMSLNLARNECLMMSIIISQKKTVVAFCRVSSKITFRQPGKRLVQNFISTRELCTLT